MSNTRTLAGFSGPVLLFLKATVKKKVFIPTYTRHDGAVIPGHWTSVHVADDHDGHKIVAGEGTHSQKQAHKALSKHAWFNELPHDHKVPVLLEHATEIQDKASAAALLSTFKKKILGGQKPTPSEWKAFDGAAQDKKAQLGQEFAAAGKTHEFSDGLVAWQQKNPPTVATAPVTSESFEAPKAAPESKPEFVPKIIKTSYDGQPVVITELEGGGYKLSVDGVEHGSFSTTNAAQAFAHKTVFSDTENPEPAAPAAPKVVAAAEKPAPAVGPNAKLAALTAAIDAAKLPPSNTNAKGVNAKLDAIAKAASAGDAKTLLMMGYGSNNYGVKATKLANQALAMLGSAHTVTPGQKMASHAGLKDAPAAAPAAPAAQSVPTPAAAPAPAAPSLPPIPLGIKQSQGVKAMQMAKKGDLAGLEDLHEKLLAPKTKAYVGELLAAAKAMHGAPAEAKDPMRGWDFDAVDPGFSGYPSIAWGDTSGGGNPAAYIVKHDEGFQALYSATGDITDDASMEHQDFATPHEAAAWLEKTHGVKVPKAALQEIGGVAYEPPEGHGAPDAAPAVVAAAENGPKEGETKQGADGTLVFRDGRWHKVGTGDGIAADAAAQASPTKVTKVVEAKMYTHTEDGHNKFWKVGIVAPDAPGGSYHVVTQYGKIGGKGAVSVKPFSSAEAASAAQGKLIKEKYGKGYAWAGNTAFTADVPSVAPAPTPKPAPKVVAASQASPNAGPASIDGWTKAGGQQGYNEGGTYVDPNGTTWYCKFPAGGEKVAKNELLATKLYALAGVSVPDVKLVTQGGKVGLASRIVDATKSKDALLAGKAKGLLSGFAVDAWLANWDTVGNNPAAGKGYDNILIKPDGSAIRIDAGGALLYGGAGGKKQQFGEKVIELQTMLNPAKNAHTAAVFGKMGSADIAASVAKVAAVSDSQIAALVMQYGPGSAGEREKLAGTLIARKKDMIAQFPAAKKNAHADDTAWVKLNPGQKIVEHGTSEWGGQFAKIENPAAGFSASKLPQPYTYDKSSSSHVNAQNTADIKAIYDTAVATHAPQAVKDLKYEGIDKATGAKTGKMLAAAEHPSKAYVQEYVNQVAAELKAQTEPTYEIHHRGSVTSSYSTIAARLAAKVKTIAHAKFQTWTDKAADYLVLNKKAGSGIPKPMLGMFNDVEPTTPALVDFKAASDAHFGKLSASEKTACKAYTGSAYWNWNSALRLGQVDSAEFKASEPMRKAFSKAAVELPEGIILHRGVNVGGDTYKSVMGAVIQDGSFQSASYGKKAAFSGMKSQLRLHVTKGVKGMMATSFSNFGTGEREIILHPNCRYVVMNVESSGNENIVDVLVLPHEE
jgi:predicted DNA-binding WGR domain protein